MLLFSVLQSLGFFAMHMSAGKIDKNFHLEYIVQLERIPTIILTDRMVLKQDQLWTVNQDDNIDL